MKVSDHWVRSPLLNVAAPARSATRTPRPRSGPGSRRSRTRTHALLQRAGRRADRHARRDRGGQGRRARRGEQLAPALALQRKAQWRLDFVAAENSMGFHAGRRRAHPGRVDRLRPAGAARGAAGVEALGRSVRDALGVGHTPAGTSLELRESRPWTGPTDRTRRRAGAPPQLGEEPMRLCTFSHAGARGLGAVLDDGVVGSRDGRAGAAARDGGAAGRRGSRTARVRRGGGECAAHGPSRGCGSARRYRARRSSWPSA